MKASIRAAVADALGAVLFLNGIPIANPAAPLALAAGANTLTGSGSGTVGPITNLRGVTYGAAYIPVSPTKAVVLANTQLADLQSVSSGVMGGSAINSGNTLPASPYFFRTVASTKEVQLQTYEAPYTKCVKVVFEQSGTDVVASVSYAKFLNGSLLGSDFDATGQVTGAVSTPGGNGYGIASVTMQVTGLATSLTISLSSGTVTFNSASQVSVPVMVGGYSPSLIAKLQPSNRANIGTTTTLGTALPTTTTARTLLSVVNAYLTTPLTQGELDIILAAPNDFGFAIAVGDRRPDWPTTIARLTWANNWSGADVSTLLLTPDPLPTPDPYNFRLTFARASGGSLTMTDNHVNTANTYGGIRGFTITAKAGIGGSTVTVTSRDALGTGNVSVSGALDMRSVPYTDQPALEARVTLGAGGSLLRNLQPPDVLAGASDRWWTQSGYFADTAATTAATVGGSVAAWRDRIGNELLTQSTATARPVVAASGLLFDRANAQALTSAVRNYGWALIAVTPTAQGAWIGEGNGSNGYWVGKGGNTFALAGNNLRGLYEAVRWDNYGTVVDGEFIIVQHLPSTGAAASVSKNGGAYVTGAGTAIAPTASFSIGGYVVPGVENRHMSGTVFEAMASNTPPSAANQARLVAYVAWRLGQQASLDPVSPYRTVAPWVTRTSAGVVLGN